MVGRSAGSGVSICRITSHRSSEYRGGSGSSAPASTCGAGPPPLPQLASHPARSDPDREHASEPQDSSDLLQLWYCRDPIPMVTVLLWYRTLALMPFSSRAMNSGRSAQSSYSMHPSAQTSAEYE